jgi:hypothetical protein
MRRRLVVAAGVMVLLAVGAAHAGELERLREENARLQQQVRTLEAENARLRGQAASVTRPAPGPSDNSGLAAALEQRANEAVSVSPAAEPGASVVATEASRLEGLQGGRSRHWITWRAERPAGGASRPDAAMVVIDATASGGIYRDVKNLDLVVDGAPVQCPVTDYRIDSMTVGKDVSARRVGESVTARVPMDTLDRLANARDISGTLGTTTFRLTPEQLAGVRAFAKRLGA